MKLININRHLHRSPKLIYFFALGFAALLSLYFLKENILPGLLKSEAIANFNHIPGLTSLYRNSSKLASEVIFNPFFYIIVAGIFTLEIIIPADRHQRVFSVGMWQDTIWLISDFLITALISIPLLAAINAFYTLFLSQYAVNIPLNLHLPRIVSVCLSILLIDFLSWIAHLLLHKLPLLWRIHAVHHSQKELNLFTDTRFHFGEALIYYPLTILPLYFLLIPLPGGIYYLWFRIWYPRLYHANIKSNFGWLRYVLVTPQSHRVHHSLYEKHYDRNLGIIFSFWDRLFQTQVRNYREYPPTGIGDRDFPHETQAKPYQLIKTYCQQLLYPFRWRG